MLSFVGLRDRRGVRRVVAVGASNLGAIAKTSMQHSRQQAYAHTEIPCSESADNSHHAAHVEEVAVLCPYKYS